MEIFQTIWTALSTPNPTLINYLMLPFIFVENLLIMLLFLSLFSVANTRKQRVSYVLITTILSIISRLFIPAPFSTYINLIVLFICISVIFKTNYIKSIALLVVPFFITILIELIFSQLYSRLLRIPYDQGVLIPIHRFCLVTIMYLVMFLLYKLIKSFKFQSLPMDELDLKTKLLFLSTCILGLILVASQLYVIVFYLTDMPHILTILNIFTLLGYFILSIYSLTRTTKLAIVNQDLEQTKLYNNTLQILHDNLRSFKHDFANIVQSIGRICRNRRYEWLKKLLHAIIRRLSTCYQFNYLKSRNH